MRRFIKLSYNGSAYHGWQRQPCASSVQQTLEESLETILRQPIQVTGAGRTDTGVHARVMYAHFDYDSELPDRKRLINGLNRICGPSIGISDIIYVHEEAHARFDATLRTYKYFVALEKSPFLNDVSWYCPRDLDVEAMNEAAALLIKTQDFTSFAKLHSDAKTNICDVSEARWDTWDNQYGTPGLVFTISADRFLRNMVRAVTGTLVDVGRKKITLSQLKKIIECKDRCAAGTSMPAQALFLWDIKYPYIENEG